MKTAALGLGIWSVAGSGWAETTMRSCVVKEVLVAAPYSYIRCQEGKSEVWLGCMNVQLKIGEPIRFADSPSLANFQSKTLKRSFPQIIFVPSLSRGNGEAVVPAPAETAEGVTHLETVPEENQSRVPDDRMLDELSQALAEGNVKEVSKFLAEPRNVERTSYDGQTPLMLAARYGKKQMVELLLKHGARVELRDPYGATALMYASKGGSVDAVRLLLERQANVNEADNSDSTALMYACDGENPQVIRLLVHHGANLQARNKSGVTALQQSCRSQKILEVLISLGADPREMDTDGNTLLMRAVRGQERADYDKKERAKTSALIQYVLSLMKDLEARNRSGETALMLAYQSRTTLEQLLKSGADPNARNARGETALMRAASGNFFDSVQMLLKYKADINLADNSGHTALWHAGHTSSDGQMMMKLLKEKGAQEAAATGGTKEFACEKLSAEVSFDLPGAGAKRQLLFLPDLHNSLQVVVKEGGSCRVVLTETVRSEALKERATLKGQPGAPYPDFEIRDTENSKPRGEEKVVKTFVWKGNSYQQKGYPESGVLNRKALSLMREGKLPEAIALWNQAYDLVHDGNAEMLNNLGFAYYKQGIATNDEKSFAFSELYLYKTIGRDPSRWQAYLNLADLQKALGKKADAVLNYEKAMSLSPSKKSAAKIRKKLEALQEDKENLVDLTTIRLKVANNLPVYAFNIQGDSEEKAPRRIIVTDTSTAKVIQDIDLLKDCDEIQPREEGEYIELLDINFDGYRDISLLAGSGATGNSTYMFWVFDPRSKRFVFAKDLAGLGTFSLDAQHKQISTHSNGGDAGMIHSDSLYEVRNGKLVLIKEVNQDYDEKKGYYVEVTEELVKGKMKVTGRKIVARE